MIDMKTWGEIMAREVIPRQRRSRLTWRQMQPLLPLFAVLVEAESRLGIRRSDIALLIDAMMTCAERDWVTA